MVRDLKDPRVGAVTFTQVVVTTDGSQATISVSLFGAGVRNEDSERDARKDSVEKPQEIDECLKGLASASGYLRRQLGQLLTVRHVPTLIFREDRGIENVSRVHELLKKVSSQQTPESPGVEPNGSRTDE